MSFPWMRRLVEIDFQCSGCRSVIHPTAAPFACPNGCGDDYHVLQKRTHLPGLALGGLVRSGYWPAAESGESAFLRFRFLSFAAQQSQSDQHYVDLFGALDHAVAAVDGGRSFSPSPTLRADALATRLSFGSGPLWFKNETDNVSGSHKARHLMGVMLYLLATERAGSPRRSLAIASCGNAALAAAVIARAAQWPIQVFVPKHANSRVLARLRELGADVVLCQRESGQLGDPTYLRFLAAVGQGSIPFCCQGNQNGLTIEGGETLGFELIDALPVTDGQRRLDNLVLQVGGGALASSVIQACERAQMLGVLAAMPRVFLVQPANTHPLLGAYQRLLRRSGMLAFVGASTGRPLAELEAAQPTPELAREIARLCADPEIFRMLRVWEDESGEPYLLPWDGATESVAEGILDDVTYDAWVLLCAMCRSGGYPVIADEATLISANTVARESTGIPVCATGSAGLAGLMQLQQQGAIAPGESIAIIFTGVQR